MVVKCKTCMLNWNDKFNGIELVSNKDVIQVIKTVYMQINLIKI